MRRIRLESGGPGHQVLPAPWTQRLAVAALVLFAVLALRVAGGETISLPQPAPHPYPDEGAPGKDRLVRLAGDPAEMLGVPPETAEAPGGTVRLQRWPAAAQGGRRGAEAEEVTLVYPGARRAIDFVAGDASALSGQITHYTTELKLTVPGVVAQMNVEHCLDARQRAAILMALSASKPPRYLGQVKDRLQRPGAGFSVQSQDSQGNAVREILVFQEKTSALLAYEQVLQPSAEQPREQAAVLLYKTFLDCATTPPR